MFYLLNLPGVVPCSATTRCSPLFTHALRDRTVAVDGVELTAVPVLGPAGANPVALVDAINDAHAELEAAQAEQARQSIGRTISRADVYAMIDYLGDVGAAIKRGDPAELVVLTVFRRGGQPSASPRRGPAAMVSFPRTAFTGGSAEWAGLRRW